MTKVTTKYWHLLGDGRVQCDVCPRACKMHEGQRGLCYVRAVEGGEVILTSYGVASGFCIDPIEKKPLNHFLPGTPVLSFGQFGCNLTCSFCQNHDISKATRDRPDLHNIYTLESEREKINETKALGTNRISQNWDISKSREFEKLQDLASAEMIAQGALKTGCKSVAFTYNDPTIFFEYAVDVAQACHAVGLKTVAVTAGYICDEPRREFFKHMDAANIDLKAFTEDFYKRLCSTELAPVLETLKYLKHETDVWFELTTLLIPGENDSEAELEEMTQWVVENLGTDVPMHFSAFHPDWKMMDIPATPFSTLSMARNIALKNGVRYAYTGNVHDFEGESTYCHNCGEMLIGRDWYQLSTWSLSEDGHCQKCGTAAAGVFGGPPGVWGAKRKRVILK
jgi:pyruvate formate lyase activating enzyme